MRYSSPKRENGHKKNVMVMSGGTHGCTSRLFFRPAAEKKRLLKATIVIIEYKLALARVGAGINFVVVKATFLVPCYVWM
jgi:hypothetical protein